MRVSSVASMAVALLATDAAAWSSSWSYSKHWRWGNGGNNENVKIVTTIVYEVPAAAPTTIVTKPKPTTVVPVAAQPTVTEVASTETETPSDDSSSSSLTSDQKAALDAHNAARKEVDADDLVWDDALAKDAQTWADHIASLGSLTHSDDTGGQGENLYAGSLDSPYTSAADLWIDEKSQYSGQPIDGNYGVYGHYTQVIWASTKKVGMAAAKGSDGSTYVVARYYPAGNYIGQTPSGN